MDRIKVGVVGATGYSGAELVRLLLSHPGVELVFATSEQQAGKSLRQALPHLGGPHDLRLQLRPLDPAALAGEAEVVFLCLPHGVSMDAVEVFLEGGCRVIDLGADFRFRDPAVYKAWYAKPHARPDLLSEAVYGLPELHRNLLSGPGAGTAPGTRARLVANPGCYPTGAILALAPLVTRGLIERNTIIVDSKSGVSGGGRAPKLDFHFPECNENIKAYRVGRHQHTPEIEQELSRLSAEPVTLTFTPHLVPMTRGILTVAYGTLARPLDTRGILACFREDYRAEPFIRVLDQEEFPETKHVAGTNRCHLGARVDTRTGRVVVVTAIDNLLKGAAGQAVQNLNVLLGLPETTGLAGLQAYWP
ncbi:MAG: N-acetyl-gamma-glutamyl-phosphate reductase [Firmicutes bacterium]|nr:N-acetyl-gamma-glutamyl-phosphate reductase [Bacillota bacterium]